MKRVIWLSLVLCGACTDFDALVDKKCLAEGKCGAGSGVLNVSPASHHFGVWKADQSAEPQVFTIRNNGTSVLTGLQVSVEGNASAFPVENLCNDTLLPDNTCTFKIGFTRGRAFGPYKATLSVRATGLDPQTFPLDAEVEAPMTVAFIIADGGVIPVEIEDGGSRPWDFGDVALGQGSQPSLKIQVTSNLAAATDEVEVTLPPPFIEEGNDCNELAPMHHCIIVVHFRAPTVPPDGDTGDFTKRMRLAFFKEENKTDDVIVTLKGRSVEPGALQVVSEDEVNPTVLFLNGVQALPAGQPGTTDFVYMIRNAGQQQIRSFNQQLFADAGWSILPQDPCKLPMLPGDHCSVTLRFHSNKIGRFPATFVVDAGPQGFISLDGTVYATGDGGFRLNVEPADAGVLVTVRDSRGIESVCDGPCQFPDSVTTTQLPKLRVSAREHPALGVPQWEGEQAWKCSAFDCELELDQNEVTLTVTQQPLAVAFVTPDSFDGDLGGLDGADEKCRLYAADAGLPGTFRALLKVDSTLFEAKRFTSGRTFIDSSGRLLTGGDVQTPFNYAQLIATGAWLGSACVENCDCYGWTINDAGATGRNTLVQDIRCDQERPFICASNEPGAPAVPDGRWVLYAEEGQLLDGVCKSFPDAGYQSLRPYVGRRNNLACNQLNDVDDGMQGPLYRHDGRLLLPAASELQDCDAGIPGLINAVSWTLFSDGGLGPLDAGSTLVARTGGTEIGGQPGLDVTCDGFTMTDTRTFRAGSPATAGTGWWQYTDAGCDAPSVFYCLGRK